MPPLVSDSDPQSPVTGTIHNLGITPTDTGPIPVVGDDDVASLPPGTHIITIVRGPSAGLRIELVGDEMTVGRAPETAIFLDDITVSRQHARFVRDGEDWSLVDLGSLNGSYVNKNRVDRVNLKSGDEIQVGKYRFRYLAADSAGTA